VPPLYVRSRIASGRPQFVSDQFIEVLTQNGIKHFRSALYYQATNGLAECFIQTMKKALKAAKSDGNLPQQLAK